MGGNIRRVIGENLGELSGLFERVDFASVEALLPLFLGDNRIYIAGAGRSGLLLRCFAMRLMHMGKRVHILGDTLTPAAGAGDVLMIGSGSGETESLVAAARRAEKFGMKTALITTNAQSTIGKLSAVTVVLPAPTPKAKGELESVASRQPMGNLFEQGMFMLLEAVVMELMRQENQTSDTMFLRHANLE